MQELKHLKIKVEELENERSQYEWKLKATKVRGQCDAPGEGTNILWGGYGFPASCSKMHISPCGDVQLCQDCVPHMKPGKQ
jgi:hypothetical protein